MSIQQPPNSATTAPTPQFFSDHRRGEVNELRQLLRLVQSERVDCQKQRDTIKKVIAFMTLGIDVSRLFGEMILACSTTDVVQKKMIYLYLTTYGETNPELALLAVNTLLKDSCDHDPAIRGLALRSLCALRAPTMLEYGEKAVRRGLTDRSGYVRRTAVMGVLKLWSLNPSIIDGQTRNLNASTKTGLDAAVTTEPNCENDNFVDILIAMLNDADPQVSTNVIHVLNEILAVDGGIPFTKRMAAALLNRIRQFNEWGQCAILNLIAHYVPETDEELFDLLNILEERVKHTSSAVVLSAAQCFLELTADHPDLREPMLMRLKTPLLTLVATASPEIAYVVLLHFQHLIVLFSDDDAREQVLRAMAGDYKLFFCGYSDPVYNKLVKLDILAAIVSEQTAFAVLSELSEYIVIDVDPTVVRKSIEVLGQIGYYYPHMSGTVVEQLLTFTDLGVDSISAPAFIVIRNLLRKFPQLFSQVKDPLQRLFPTFSDQESIAASLWIIGRFGEEMEDAPYMLEALTDKLCQQSASNNSNSISTTLNSRHTDKPTSHPSVMSSGLVVIELLSAAIKVFILRPPEMQKTLGKLLNSILSDDSVEFDVRDRALHFYRFLADAKSIGSSKVLALLKSVLMETETGSASMFFEELESQRLLRTITEFNTLSIIFKQPTDKYVLTSSPINFNGRYVPSETFLAKPKQIKSATGNGWDDPYKSSQSKQINKFTNLVEDVANSDNLLGDLHIDSNSTHPIITPSTITPEEFESLWLPTPILFEKRFSVQSQIPHECGGGRATPERLLDAVQLALVDYYCVASGTPPQSVKFFFCCLVGQQRTLLELTIANLQAVLVVKSEGSGDRSVEDAVVRSIVASSLFV